MIKKTAALTLFAIFTLISSALASDMATLKAKHRDIELQSKWATNSIKTDPKDKAEESVHRWYFLQKDLIAVNYEILGISTASEEEKEAPRRELDNMTRSLEIAYPALLEEVSKRTPPEVDNLDVSEVERTDYFVTYGIKLDVKNDGEPRKFYVKIAATRLDGHEVDYTTISGTIDQGGEETLTGSLMVSTKVAANIRGWKISETKYYKAN